MRTVGCAARGWDTVLPFRKRTDWRLRLGTGTFCVRTAGLSSHRHSIRCSEAAPPSAHTMLFSIGHASWATSQPYNRAARWRRLRLRAASRIHLRWRAARRARSTVSTIYSTYCMEQISFVTSCRLANSIRREVTKSIIQNKHPLFTAVCTAKCIRHVTTCRFLQCSRASLSDVDTFWEMRR